ncbi:MAG: M20/M25/M40 family metallo-hydrolase [Cytophagales bacterium]|nr:M20/M25/M40 family metallo-hydrolase [Cytophagales bacterium]
MLNPAHKFWIKLKNKNNNQTIKTILVIPSAGSASGQGANEESPDKRVSNSNKEIPRLLPNSTHTALGMTGLMMRFFASPNLFIQINRSALLGIAIIIFGPLFSQDIQRARQTIDTLCSVSMHGRGYVNAGDKIAAEFIKAQFENIGVKIFRSSYLQYFNLDVNTFPKKIKLKINGNDLLPGKDFIVDAISRKGKGRCKVQYLDTLIFTDLPARLSGGQAKDLSEAGAQKAQAGKDAREQFLEQSNKKKVFVYDAKHYGQLLELPLEFINKIHESKAIIELREKKLTVSISNSQLSNPFFEIKKSDWPLYVGRHGISSKQRVITHNDKSLIDTKTQKKRNDMSDQVKKIKVRFRVDAELIENYQSQNIIGFIKGKEVPDTFLVFSAHYDHLGMMGNDVYFPGANDNASGVAMLLELARYYAMPGNEPHCSIVFIAFGGEEAGLAGSKYYTQNPLFPLRRIKFLINLDLMGTGQEGMTVVNGTIFNKEFEKLMKINQQRNYLPQIKKRGEAANSDHFFFTEKGVPSFFFYTLGNPKHYHDIYDIPETLPLTGFEGIFKLILDFVEQL